MEKGHRGLPVAHYEQVAAGLGLPQDLACQLGVGRAVLDQEDVNQPASGRRRTGAGCERVHLRDGTLPPPHYATGSGDRSVTMLGGREGPEDLCTRTRNYPPFACSQWKTTQPG